MGWSQLRQYLLLYWNLKYIFLETKNRLRLEIRICLTDAMLSVNPLLSANGRKSKKITLLYIEILDLEKLGNYILKNTPQRTIYWLQIFSSRS